MIGFRSLELVVQDRREPGVGALRHPGGVERGLPLHGVEVDVEVLGLDDLEVERLVLDLVLAEVLGRQRAPGRQSSEQRGRRAVVEA